MNKVRLDKCGLDCVKFGPVSVPLIGGTSGGLNLPDWFEESIVCWYDPKRQRCTNEKMAENPVLQDLSGNKLDMGCYEFAWTEESGITGDKGIHFDGVTSYCLQIPADRPQLKNGFTVIYKRKFEDDYANPYLIADNNTINTKCIFAFVVSSQNTVFNICGSYQPNININTVIKDKAIEYLVTNKYYLADGRILTLKKGSYSDEEKFPFVLGRVRTVSSPWNQTYSKYTLYSLLIFSKELTVEEIEWVKTNLMS